jgi:flagellar basal body-associated protein FliL
MDNTTLIGIIVGAIIVLVVLLVCLYIYCGGSKSAQPKQQNEMRANFSNPVYAENPNMNKGPENYETGYLEVKDDGRDTDFD